MSAILKQKLIDIANGFTKYGLWKGGGSGGSSAYITFDLNNIITTIQASKVQEYTAENNCFISVPILSKQGTSIIYIDDKIVASLYSDGNINTIVTFPPIFLEKGKTIKIERIGNKSYMWHEMTVYGVKYI